MSQISHLRQSSHRNMGNKFSQRGYQKVRADFYSRAINKDVSPSYHFNEDVPPSYHSNDLNVNGDLNWLRNLVFKRLPTGLRPKKDFKLKIKVPGREYWFIIKKCVDSKHEWREDVWNCLTKTIRHNHFKDYSISQKEKFGVHFLMKNDNNDRVYMIIHNTQWGDYVNTSCDHMILTVNPV